MTSARLDRDVIGQILLMNLERVRERHVTRTAVYRGLFRSMLAQKFLKPRFRDREMGSLETLPDFFAVREGPGIITTGFMSHQILLTGFFPRFRSGFCFTRFHCFALICTPTVE